MLESLLFQYILLILSVVFHEFGHYIIARYYNFPIFEFSLFIGKKIWQKGIFSIRTLPAGAYVAYGYETEDKRSEYINQRAAVAAGGLLFNIILIELGIILGINSLITINVLMIALNVIPLGVFNGNVTDAKKIIDLICERKMIEKML